MTKHFSDKRRRQMAFLPYMLEHVLGLILNDSEYGLHHPDSLDELDELKRSIPLLREAHRMVKSDRESIVNTGKVYVSLKRDYKELFSDPLRERKTGYAFTLLVYMCQQLLKEGGDLSDNILDAVNLIAPIAEHGHNAKMIDGMKTSADRLAPKIIKNLRRRDYLLIPNVGVAA